MRSLIGLLIFLVILGGAAFAAMWALDTYVEPSPREMTIDIPLDRVLDDPEALVDDPYAQGTVQRRTAPAEDAEAAENADEAPAAQ